MKHIAPTDNRQQWPRRGITNAAVLAELETVMRHDIFHSTLDWQTPGQLRDAAKQAAKILDLRIKS